MKEVAMELERLRTRQGDCIHTHQLKQAEVIVRKSIVLGFHLILNRTLSQLQHNIYIRIRCSSTYVGIQFSTRSL
ncbi:hypothetical protein Gogos_005434, partial [Gossypium gossypioides]|nr:hypothetical protein [Gossypium gossypioides]